MQPPAALADILEGQVRPGFFTGVCTVMLKLFNTAQPRLAVFGKKDDQQLMVVRNMVRQLALPIEILAGETSRADDGLALSSRNGNLSADQRSEAVALSAELRRIAQALRGGGQQSGDAGSASHGQPAPARLGARRRGHPSPGRPAEPQPGDARVVLAAARLGSTRLIDNLDVD